MRLAEILGAVTALLLAFVVFSALAGPSPAYRYWGEESQRLVPAEPNAEWRAVSILLFGGLFPLFVSFGLVVLTLVIGLSALLRGEE
ncbi:hypothetical protein CSUB_C1673 [Candidatus Caldarchaeum subterraneum]|uniref:Uncharacterized protein n=1 Tax=Caldiarchaeum subterraneum TaxID=311458 RepID=E6N9D4_CALS0|nr:hypothetical protein HGMM_F09F01C39 [Candidatus Caldarchaeum subterraneum]BAJ49788.1 hypothetical protein HGMM_F20G01C37 [Candidatus Caldarchaeum subterraneum]BAJ51524.1 hypothetical protein CSUB_C1673 [Candidatus Caldarchaeum subterraneum]